MTKLLINKNAAAAVVMSGAVVMAEIGRAHV